MKTHTNIVPRPSRRGGVVTEFINDRGTWNADIVLGKSIRIYGTLKTYVKNVWTRRGRENVYEDVPFDRTFVISEFAEYDSWNLSYYGPITKISANSVTIADKNFSSDRKKRLDLYTFISRNVNFNHIRANEKNAEEMMYL